MESVRNDLVRQATARIAYWQSLGYVRAVISRAAGLYPRAARNHTSGHRRMTPTAAAAYLRVTRADLDAQVRTGGNPNGRTGQPKRIHLDDVAHLAHCGEDLPAIARHLRVQEASVVRACMRHEEHELLARIRRAREAAA